jgi:hypothetical protein
MHLDLQNTWSQQSVLYRLDGVLDPDRFTSVLGYLNDGTAGSLGVGAFSTTATLSRELREVAAKHRLELVEINELGKRLVLSSVPWGAANYRELIDDLRRLQDPDDWPTWLLTEGAGRQQVDSITRRKRRLLAFMQLTMLGLPVINAGEEWDQRDSEYDPDSLANMYSHLIMLRRTCPALSHGDYRPIEVDHPEVFGYVRETELQKMIVLLNFAHRAARVDSRALKGGWVAGTDVVEGDGLSPANELLLDGLEGRMYELRRGER